MNHDPEIQEDTLPDALSWSLRGLRCDVVPQHDLWRGIAAHIAEAPAATTYTSKHASTHASTSASNRRHRRKFNGVAPLAIAASLVFAVGIAWQLRPLSPDAGTSRNSNLAQEAAAMTREYDAAIGELAAGHRIDMPVLRELDRTASTIRTAMTRDPDARFLLDRLRHTYERRLALTQRIALI